MKKKIINRALLGFPIGITIGYLVTILVSLIWAKGHYWACTPKLVEMVGNEIKAVILQALACGLLGSGFAASSLIWEIDTWSLFKQTLTYFITVLMFLFPTAYILHWMEHSLTGFLSYFGIFLTIFISIWIFQFTISTYNVRKLNKSLFKIKDNKN